MKHFLLKVPKLHTFVRCADLNLLYEDITRNPDVAEAEKGMAAKSEEFIEQGKRFIVKPLTEEGII
jgi:hypothetical protein